MPQSARQSARTAAMTGFENTLSPTLLIELRFLVQLVWWYDGLIVLQYGCGVKPFAEHCDSEGVSKRLANLSEVNYGSSQ